jgi:hypothetical protein
VPEPSSALGIHPWNQQGGRERGALGREKKRRGVIEMLQFHVRADTAPKKTKAGSLRLNYTVDEDGKHCWQ